MSEQAHPDRAVRRGALLQVYPEPQKHRFGDIDAAGSAKQRPTGANCGVVIMRLPRTDAEAWLGDWLHPSQDVAPMNRWAWRR